jgi:hypothetical protein
VDLLTYPLHPCAFSCSSENDDNANGLEIQVINNDFDLLQREERKLLSLCKANVSVSHDLTEPIKPGRLVLLALAIAQWQQLYSSSTTFPQVGLTFKKLTEATVMHMAQGSMDTRTTT